MRSWREQCAAGACFEARRAATRTHARAFPSPPPLRQLPLRPAPCAGNVPVHPPPHLVAALDELDGDQLACALVARELHEAERAAVQVAYLQSAVCLGRFDAYFRCIRQVESLPEAAAGPPQAPDRALSETYAHTVACYPAVPPPRPPPPLVPDFCGRARAPSHTAGAPRGARACPAACCCCLFLLLLAVLLCFCS